ncbi:hypothetical protein MMC21_001589 [Puttea exsequens]|nr:hypothetical protein [Puttea exsequens]
MTDQEAEYGPKTQTSVLVQSKLTSAFFKPNYSAATTSPYFAKDTSSTESQSDHVTYPQLAKNEKFATNDVVRPNLHTERRSNLNRPPPSLGPPRRSVMLTHIAAETKSLLPNILKLAPNAPPHGTLHNLGGQFRLDQSYCPDLPRTPLRVLNADSIDSALSLASRTARKPSKSPDKPVFILNMANAHHSGGGWLHGALAQEEALCYRSSLSFTLKNKFYPIPDAGGIYSPTVLVIRESMGRGHDLLDLSKPEKLPVVSCVSVAAVRGPEVVKDGEGRERYKHVRDREAMKEKMRVVLRVAAVRRHRVLVLGALGCGAFGNPREEVMSCWKEVFGEAEFAGGWWERVVFAVMEKDGKVDGDENFGVFFRGLDGLEV